MSDYAEARKKLELILYRDLLLTIKQGNYQLAIRKLEAWIEDIENG